ncbi:MAG: ATP synthase F0 subunit B [Phycisphaerae bacterium]|nr:ATP synthase F0 subunit B [Phycisphaerae bacterium]
MNPLVLAADNPAAFNWMPGVTAIVVFLIVLVVLSLFVWPKISKGLDDRNEKILSEIKSAEEAREQAKAALAEYERNLAEAREEANQMIQSARAEAKRVAEDLKAKNEAELAERLKRASHDIETAKKAAISQLHDSAADLAAAVAGKILDREVNAADQKQLVEESLKELSEHAV